MSRGSRRRGRVARSGIDRLAEIHECDRMRELDVARERTARAALTREIEAQLPPWRPTMPQPAAPRGLMVFMNPERREVDSVLEVRGADGRMKRVYRWGR